MRSRRLLVISCVLIWLAACGDTSSTSDTTVDAVSDTGSDTGSDASVGQDSTSSWYDSGYVPSDLRPNVEACTDLEDNDGDGDVDCADAECADRLVCGDSLTAEEESNDSKETAQTVSLPIRVRGGIGSFTEEADGDHSEDRDWYAFEVTEPTMVRWEFDDANGFALLQLALFGLDDDTDHVDRRLDIDTPGAVRHTYLARAGRYGVEVRDIRNTRRSGEELPYGGDGYVYAFSLDTVTFAAEDIPLPFETTGTAELGAENTLPVYSVSLDSGGVFEAEVVAQRLNPTSGLDAILYVIDQSDNAILRFEDDPSTSTVDPIVRTGILDEDTSALLIVDAYRVSRQTTHTLRAEMLAPSLDWEPNNPVDLGYPVEAGSTVTGEVSAPILRYRTMTTDTDYFYIRGGPSASYEIEVAAVGGDLDASLRTGWLGYSGGTPVLGEVFTANPNGTRDARLEAVSLYDRTLFIEVADRRNLFDEESDPVGGESGFEYELTVTARDRTIEPVTLPHSENHELTNPGEVDWYASTAPERTVLRVRSAPTADASPDITPWIYLATEADILLRRSEGSLRYLFPFETAYHLGVMDRAGGGGADYDYSLEAASVTFTSVDEVEPNDGPPEGGQILADEGPWWVTGTTSGTNETDFDADVFIVALEAGQLVVIETIDGVDTESDNADTVLTVTGPGLEEPATDTDAGVGRFSLLEIETIEEGSFEITVTPQCNDRSCSGGDYSLAIWTEDLPDDGD